MSVVILIYFNFFSLSAHPILFLSLLSFSFTLFYLQFPRKKLRIVRIHSKCVYAWNVVIINKITVYLFYIAFSRTGEAIIR